MSELEEVVPANSAFHPDNVQQYTLLTLMQIKDLLGVIAANLSESQTEGVERLHDAGQLLYPLPWLDNAPPEDEAQTVTE